MTKLELNNKLAELYNLPAKKLMMTSVTCTIIDGKQKDTYTTGYALLIDDWSILMDLAVDNKIFELFESRQTNNYFSLKNRSNLQYMVFLNKDHKLPQAATRFAIAMALVKLKEDK